MAAPAPAAEAAAAGADWELSKENFQPLKAGRKPGGLRDNTAELRKQLVEEQRRAFWEEIAGYHGDDPLEAWLRFIKWTQETFSAGGHKAELLPLLERCTRELQSLPRYQNDIRYLRVWVQYADCLPDPGDVFLFLKENGIGLEHALYYIAFATYLELRGSYAKADAVYQQGINRLAAPVDRLKAKFAEFQHRMARRIQRKAQEQQSGSAEPEHPGRQTLGTIAARRPARGGLPGPAGLKRKAGTPPRPGQENAGGGGSGGGLSIFMDEEFQADAPPAQSAPAAMFAVGRSAAGPWSKLGSFEQSRKENTQRAGVWAGQKMRQAPAHSAPPAPALEILVDPEFEEAAQQEEQEGDQAEPTLRQRLERSSKPTHLDEALANDPLRLHRAQPVVPPAGVLPAGGGLGLQPRPAAAAAMDNPEAKRRREEVMAFDEASLAAEDGVERSFEELRAVAWQASGAAVAAGLASTRYPGNLPLEPAVEQQQPEHSPAKPMEADCTPQRAGQAEALEVAPAAAQHSPQATVVAVEGQAGAASDAGAGGAAGGQELLQGSVSAAAVDDGGFKVPPPRARSGHQLVEPTMTISTRNAFAAINGMFQGSLPAEHAALPPHPHLEPTLHGAGSGGFGSGAFGSGNLGSGAFGSSNFGSSNFGSGNFGSGGYEPTMTLATRSAFAAINNMFKGSLPNEHGALPPRAGPAEPTVTLNTRAAFEAINGMFGGGGNGARPQGAAGGGLDIREDTTFFSVPDQEQEAGGGGFCIREDTQFIRPPAVAQPAAGGGFSIREDTQFIRPAPQPEPAGGGFSIREDTVFLKPGAAPGAPAAADGGLSFSIREDTQFIKPAAAAPTPAREAGAAAAAPVGLSFSIREDTQFICPPQQAAAATAVQQHHHHHQQQGLHTRGAPATASPAPAAALAAPAEQVSKWGFAPGADDTLQLDLGGDTQTLGLLGPLVLQLQPAAGTGEVPPAAPGSSGSLDAHLRELHITEDKENAAGAPHASCAALAPRSIHDAQTAAAALQPLRPPTRGSDSDAEALLQQQGCNEQDSFEVEGDESGSSPGPRRSPCPSSSAPAPPPTVDPFEPGFQAALLASLEPPVLQWAGVCACSQEEEAHLRAALRSVRKAGASAVQLQLGGEAFEVQRYVGAGAYATVYQAINEAGDAVAIKLESPPCPWEWYICQALHARLPEALRPRFVDPTALAVGPGASLLVQPYGPCGSLQDLLNAYMKQGQRPDEVVAMHFAMELLRLLGGLHGARVLHCDLKPDNLLLRVEQGASGADENAAPTVELQLIDFGRSVDLELLPPGALLQGDSGTDAFRCVEMREGSPWLYQADAYGACGVVHCLLFGNYMEVERVQDAAGAVSLRLRQGWKRYWAQELWEMFFGTLLNHTVAHAPPPAAALLARFEAHLAAMPAAARKLQTELRKLAAMCSGN